LKPRSDPNGPPPIDTSPTDPSPNNLPNNLLINLLINLPIGTAGLSGDVCRRIDLRCRTEFHPIHRGAFSYALVHLLSHCGCLHLKPLDLLLRNKPAIVRE
jgi:hypothetical protein